jgi:8-oxo-dGTP pyrophosphatase MutT (NUDIX family)
LKIFLNDRTIEFTRYLPDNTGPSDLIVEYRTMAELKDAWDQFAGNDHYRRLCIYDPHEFQLPGIRAFTTFAAFFRLIYAAGGLVRNEKGEYLFIHRYGYWDLPKGKIDAKDVPTGPGYAVTDLPAARTAAVREVQEETGLERITVIRTLPATWHIYHLSDKYILKRTQWFEMEADSLQPLKPDPGEGIALACWTSRESIRSILSQTYASIRELLLEVLFRDGLLGVGLKTET